MLRSERSDVYSHKGTNDIDEDINRRGGKGKRNPDQRRRETIIR